MTKKRIGLIKMCCIRCGKEFERPFAYAIDPANFLTPLHYCEGTAVKTNHVGD